MDPKITQEILDDLIPSIEAVEAKSTAVLEFLKNEGIATDEKLAPYLEQAASASNVRWLGVRVRVERLLSAAEKDSAVKQADNEDKTPEAPKTKSAGANPSNSDDGDNSKSGGPENPNESVETEKGRKTEVKGNDKDPKIIAADKTATHDDRSGQETNDDKSKSVVPAGEQRVA